MSSNNLRAALIAVTLGTLVALSGIGIGAATLSQQPSAVEQPAEVTQTTVADAENGTSPADDDVVEAFEERIESLETVEMTYEMNATFDGDQTMTSEQTVWADYENDRIRTETESDQTETITVRNESKTVTYDVENNQVHRYDNSGDAGPQTIVDQLLSNGEYTYEERESLDGEETYRLDVTPTNTGDVSDVDATLWLDTDTHFPTQLTTSYGGDDYDYETTVTFRNVSLNEPIPDERFTIDIPDDAEEPDYSVPDRTSYDSLSALEEDTDRSAPAPDVPDAYSFEEGHVTDGDDYHLVTLQYTTDDGETLRVSQQQSETNYDYGESDRYDEVDVGDHTGYYAEFEYDGETTSILDVNCENNSYSISGDLSKEESIEVAESLACE